jgi:hypothetical protein
MTPDDFVAAVSPAARASAAVSKIPDHAARAASSTFRHTEAAGK